MKRFILIANLLLVGLLIALILHFSRAVGQTTATDINFLSFNPLQQQGIPAEQTITNGFWLAWIIVAGMLLAVIVSGVVVARAFQGKVLAEPQGWLVWATPILSLLGLGVAIYLTYVEGTQAQAICGPIGDCNAVQSSQYAKIFGVIPVGLFGALGYIGILVAWSWRRWRKDSLAEIAGLAMFGMAAFGVLYSFYLTYLELFVIRAVCIWCLSSAAIITLLLLLSLGPASKWLAAMDEED